jgi:hypothetical protein
VLVRNYEQWQQDYELAREVQSIDDIQKWAGIMRPTEWFNSSVDDFPSFILPQKG